VRYLFSNRRWMNPEDSAEDAEGLRNGYKELCDASIVFKGQCSVDKFLRIITKYCKGWEESSRASRKAARRKSTLQMAAEGGPRGEGFQASKRRCSEGSLAGKHGLVHPDPHAPGAVAMAPGLIGAENGVMPMFIPSLMQVPVCALGVVVPVVCVACGV
jgi:hypothetical protein